MITDDLFKDSPATSFRLKEKRPGIYQLIAPIFHEDGDMVSIYLEDAGDKTIKICDHGMSLMRLDYLFDMDSDRKRKILNDIVANRDAILDQGDIELFVSKDNLFSGVMSFAQLVSEVCSMDILNREAVATLFYDYLSESIEAIRCDKKIQYIKDYEIKDYPDINIDYAFLGDCSKRPIYLFGVRDTNKAQQTAINCMRLTIDHIPHKSVCVFEDIDAVTRFARNSLLNATDKVYSDLNNFKQNGADYILRELAS